MKQYMKVKKGDTVQVLRGRDNGKKAAVLTVIPSRNVITVEGVNMTKRHTKPRRRGEKGTIVEVAMPIPASNVAVVCPKCSESTRIGYNIDSSGHKERQCKKCKVQIA